MAKRRRLAPPTADELAEMEAGFAPNKNLGSVAPIAQIAGEAAAEASPLAVTDRAAVAQDEADAAAYRAARDGGALIQMIPVGDIEADQMTRDRLDMSPEEMAELSQSISAHGVRMPIEVFALNATAGGGRFGLLTGYRRLHATRQLLAQTGAESFATIPAIVKEPTGLADAFTAMVEENEIRASLSHYERGRIAALASHQGAFSTIDDAVATLFFAASKAKRSKVRSFAMIHEELGDLLGFPQSLTERMGLRLANALRSGFGPALREVMSGGHADNPEAEWRLVEPLIVLAEEDDTGKRQRGGRRSARATGRTDAQTFDLGAGRVLNVTQDGKGHVLRLSGQGLSAEVVDEIAAKLAEIVRKS